MPRDEAFVVHFDAEDFDTHGRSGFYRRCKGVLFGQDIVSALGEHPVGHVECGGTAGREGDLPVLVRWVVHDLGVFGDEAEELGRASRLTIVHGNVDIVIGLAFLDIVFAGAGDYAGFLGLDFREVIDSRDLNFDTFKRKVLAGRKTTA